MRQPMATVVIPCRNDPSRLQRCLSALEKQSYRNFEVIVVDSGSDPPLEVDPGLKFDRFTTIREERPGSYLARNRGIEAAQGELLAFTDADAIPAESWLQEGLRAMQESGAGIVGGAIKVQASDYPNPYELLDIALAFPQRWYIEERGFSVTANLFTWRDVVRKAGPFREDFTSSGDFEFGQRVRSSSYKVSFAPAAVVSHPARRTLPEHSEKWCRLARGFVHRCATRGEFIKLCLNALLRLPLPPLRTWGKIWCQRGDLSRSNIVALFGLTWLRRWVITAGILREVVRRLFRKL